MNKRTILPVINYLSNKPLVYKVTNTCIQTYRVKEITHNTYSILIKLDSSLELDIIYPIDRPNVYSIDTFKKDFALSNNRSLFLIEQDAIKNLNRGSYEIFM